MAANPTDNPLRQSHDTIWTALEASSDFTNKVPESNRLQYDDDDNPPDLGSVDDQSTSPFVAVLSLGMDPEFTADSSASESRWIWSIVVKEQTEKLVQLLDMDWIVFEALKDAWSTYFLPLTYNDIPFARDFRGTNVKHENDRLQDLQLVGNWRSVWTGFVHIVVSRA